MKKALLAIIGFILLISFFALNPLVQINEGHRGVVLDFGAFNGQIMEPGLRWRTPIVQDVVEMEVRTQKAEFIDMVAFSADKQDVYVDVGVNYNLDPGQVGNTYSRFGSDVTNKVIFPSVHQIVKQNFNRLKADEIIKQREELRAAVLDQLRPQLNASNVIVTDLYLEDIDFSESYKAAIERAQIAEQNAVEQVNITRQEEEKKKQAILQAEAKAERARLEGLALNSGGDRVIEKIKAEAMKVAAEKWNGQVPNNSVFGGTIMDSLVQKFR